MSWQVHLLQCDLHLWTDLRSSPHIIPPLRNMLHTIKGLAKTTNSNVPGLILWTSVDESRRSHPTLGNLLCVGGCEWQDGVTRSAHRQQQEENSASTALPTQPSTENMSLESRCQSTLPLFDVMQDGRHQPQVCKHESRTPSITRVQPPQQIRESVGFHLAKTNKIWGDRNSCRCT